MQMMSPSDKPTGNPPIKIQELLRFIPGSYGNGNHGIFPPFSIYYPKYCRETFTHLLFIYLKEIFNI
jgi:hypothetical protein